MSNKLPEVVQRIQSYKKEKVNYETQNSISFSQFYMYSTCPHQWYLTHVRKLAPYTPSIHSLFGTSVHEVVQKWLTEMYTNTIKSSNEMDLHELLEERMKKTFKKEKYRNGHESFSNPKEMMEFYRDGVGILKFLKRKRSDYFDKKHTHLVGVEIPIVQEVKTNLFFKGYIDLVFYNEKTDKFKIIDIKTSTSGWNKYTKKDDLKISQLLLYKHFFSQQFDIDIDKIDVEYFILKRKLPDTTDYTPKFVQLFSPSSGKIKRGKTMKLFNQFLKDCFDENGQYLDKEFNKEPSKNNCRFCPFKENKYLCNVGVS